MATTRKPKTSRRYVFIVEHRSHGEWVFVQDPFYSTQAHAEKRRKDEAEDSGEGLRAYRIVRRVAR